MNKVLGLLVVAPIITGPALGAGVPCQVIPASRRTDLTRFAACLC
jgi:hypothetical protein